MNTGGAAPPMVHPPRIWAVAAACLVVTIAALLACLLVSPDALWTGGSGVLRGTRRAFAFRTDAGFVLSWDSLGLLVAFCVAAMTAVDRVSARQVLGAVGVVGLATTNHSMLVAASWTLVAIACTAALRGSQAARWAAGVSSMLSAGVALSVLAVREVPAVLHSPAGQRGALDAAGISLVRHILTGSLAGIPTQFLAVPPLLAALASVLLVAGSSRDVAAIAVGAGPLLLLKVYPLIELATRGNPVAVSAVMIPAVLMVAVAGVTSRPPPCKEGVVAGGGSLVLMAARLPVEAVVWAAVWVCIASDRRRGILGALVPGAAASWVALAGFAATDPRPGRLAVCVVVAAGSALALDRPNPRPRWMPGFVLGSILALALLPPVAPGFWQVWSGKLRPVFPLTLRPWAAVAGGVACALVMRSGGRVWLTSLRDRFARLMRVVAERTRRWVCPAVDVGAVVWVAVERFGWQGMSLWLPRRILTSQAIGVSWFQTVVMPVLGRLPLHLIGLVRLSVRRIASTPQWWMLALGAVLAAAWLL